MQINNSRQVRVRILKFAVLLSGFASIALVHSAAQADVDYSRDIRPILARNCYACHGPETQEAGLGLHTEAAAGAELDSGARAIRAGQPELSELLVRVQSEDLAIRMPPEGHEPLADGEVDKLRQWIADGAKFEQHWAFEPLRPVAIPATASATASAHPIDRFIDAELQTQKLQAAEPASRRTLIRRLYFDLIGLPPTPEQVAAFVDDSSPDSYERLVDELLASKRYGEKWARHWLDVVRYAETNSFERDGNKPNAWKYRDYVIDAFNEDKPYDQFLREQLAGDELPERDRESIIATGFYRLGIWDDEPADRLLARYDEFDDILTTISQGMLGLTVNCARCHDHKIDPIPQADYYQMVALLRGITPYGTRGDQLGNNQTDVSSPELVARYADLDQKLAALKKEMYELEQVGVVKMSAADQRATETRDRQKVLDAKLRNYLDAEQWQAYEVLQQRRNELNEQRKQLPGRETVLSVARVDPNPEVTHVMLRGNPHVPGEVVQPGFPQIFEQPLPELPSVSEQDRSSRRRLLLANWITSSDNRLTSRVMVNRIWQHHFGRGIVRTPNNFGLLGAPPTHPELLNWLAQYFVENGWRIKPLHKLIVTSDAYRRSSQAVPESLAQDPNNDYFWRFDLRRLSAEELRDSVLAVSGALNLKMHGPSIYPQLSQEVLSTQSRPGEGWGQSSPAERNRRSIYIFIKRSLLPPELATFDFPETDVTCEARFVTIQPAQALNSVNGEFLNQQASRFAERLRTEAANQTEQISRGWQLVTGRNPTAGEMKQSEEFMQLLAQKHELSADAVLKYFCLYLLNLNEFVFVD